MFLHIVFKDGSNPYVKYGEDKELKKEIKKWSKEYNLEVRDTLMNNKVVGYTVTAENKREAMIKEMYEKECREAELNGEFIPLF